MQSKLLNGMCAHELKHASRNLHNNLVYFECEKMMDCEKFANETKLIKTACMAYIM